MFWTFALLITFLVALYLIRKEDRSSSDVLSDLAFARDSVDSEEMVIPSQAQSTDEDEYFQAGIFTREEKRRFQSALRTKPFLIGACLGAIVLLVTQNFAFAVLAFSGGVTGQYLLGRRELFLRKQRLIHEIDFYLPVVMERLVMTAQAGFDVFSGIRVVSELAKEDGEVDPVTALLDRVYHLNERGIGFEEALSQVSSRIESAPLRHAFIHLAVAQKEGGELVLPLRELSDSTQNYFQETIEERISKLPVQATIPLFLTFAGLVIFFMTSPMMQVLKLGAGGFAK